MKKNFSRHNFGRMFLGLSSLLVLSLWLLSTAGLVSAEQQMRSGSDGLSPDQNRPVAQEQQKQEQIKTEQTGVGQTAPRPIEIKDILAWKNISLALVSNDGRWFVYALTPNEGDSELVIKEVDGKKEYRFPLGEAPRSLFDSVLVSDDSRWVSFLSHPSSQEMKKLRKEKKRVEPKAILVDLRSGERTEWTRARKIAFSGESSAYLAVHRLAPEAQEKEKDKWTGSDLVLKNLVGGQEIGLGNVSEFAFNKSGQWLAFLVDAQDRSGNGLMLQNIKTGEVRSLDSGRFWYKNLNWDEKGQALSALKGREDKKYEDKLYSLVAFKLNPASGQEEKYEYDPAGDSSFPEGFSLSPDFTPYWLEDYEALAFGIKQLKTSSGTDRGKEGDDKGKKEAAPPSRGEEVEDEDLPDLILWHWQDPRLQSQQQVEERRDASFSYLSIFRVKEKKFVRLADDELRQVELGRRSDLAVGYDRSLYELEGSLSGQRFQDIYVVDLKTGQRKPALKQNRWSYDLSPDGRYLLYYHEGHFYAYELATGQSFNLTARLPASFINEDDDHNVKNPPDRPFGWSKDGRYALLSDGWDVWLVEARGRQGYNLTGNGFREQIRYNRRFVLDPEEKGIDLDQPQYFQAYGEWTKKQGIALVEPARRTMKMLLFDDAQFNRLLKARKASRYFYTRETHRDFPDFYASDASLGRATRITEANPRQKEFLWSAGARLVDYVSSKGKKLQAALFLPADYQEGKKYPTIVYIYEKLSSGLNRYFLPTANGFNKSYYTSQGYAVLMPDITYTINDPGMSAVWCVLPALKAAIETGVVDPERVGLQGHSWGGYQTAFLITQTEAFAAAVAGAPLTNMISMYSSIYWNTGSANQPIFESSQGRFTGGYWENLEAYTRNSPVYYATRVKTPLLLLHNDKDGAVVFNQGVEYYNTLRRLKKPVVMLEYVGENHGLQKPANRKDYTVRMKEFFDHHLKGQPAPEWWEKGVPYLKLKDHLRDRVRSLKAEGEEKSAEAGK
ncbi:MAG: prolyl oligopeptidase family serine peptidase [Candidatus Saccharicenans sp.]|nr:prolyl oligopeptidase family serine peptidase [Candidatus Saccharicenans sp.]MDI6848928.1 prolyl oligopeptidase family serine peptidase [Candidatus Saccharicenans sp.]